MSDIERKFIALVFCPRNRKTRTKTFIEAQNMGAVADWFQDPSCRLIWLAAVDLFAKADFDKASIFRIQMKANELAVNSQDYQLRATKIDQQFFEKLNKSILHTDKLVDYCNPLKDAFILRKVEEFQSNMKEGFASGMNVKLCIAQFMRNLQGLLKGNDLRGKVSVAGAINQVIERYRDIYHHRVELGEEDYTVGLPLPWRHLAYTLNGFDKVLTILAARPGVGKTSLAVELVQYWLDCGLHVVFSSLDMASSELIKRQLTKISQISSRKMLFARSTDFQKDITAIEEAGNKLKKFEEDGMYTLCTESDIDVLRTEVEMLKIQGLIDVLVVDHIQLMHTQNQRVRSRKDEVSYVSNQLHAIATELNIPVLALSQINRESQKESAKNGTDTEPQLHNIKDSGDIEQDATNVIILYPNSNLLDKWVLSPPKGFLPPGHDSTKTLMPMWLKVAKARDGEADVRLPFLVVQNRHSWYLGDWEKIGDAKWDRVYANYGDTEDEKNWRKNHTLIEQSSIKGDNAP